MMDIDERIEDTLAHYGVKGMKWGVRRSKKGSGVKSRLKNPDKWSQAELTEWGKKNNHLFSERQKTAFSIKDRIRLSFIGSGSSPKKIESQYRVDRIHHPFSDDGFGNHYAMRNDKKTTYEYNHETKSYKDLKKSPSKFVQEMYDSLYDDDEAKHYDSFTEDDLAHFGVKGMKWGVRRIRKDIRKITKAKAREARVKAKQTKPTHTEQKKKNDEMFLTDEELRGRINRLQMEKTYQQLTMPEKSKGKKLFEKIVVSQTEAIAKEVYKTAVKAIVENKIASIKGDDKKKK